MPAQDHPDQFGPPLGVLLAQGPGLHHEGLGGAGTAGRPVIGRRWSLAAVVAPQAEQMVDRAQGEVEALGQGRRGQPALVAAEDDLTESQGGGAWHGRKLRKNTAEANRAQRP
jgi:hypothetical protein